MVTASLPRTQVLIVGGGLSGLSLAWRLERLGLDYRVIEARDRLGGRILTAPVLRGTETAGFDLGPAWFWPGQPRIARLIQELSLAAFDQYAHGDLMFEAESGLAQRGRGFSSMAGSYRLLGGFGAMIDGLARAIPTERILVSCRAVKVSRAAGQLHSEVLRGEGLWEVIESDCVVLCLPPRLAAESIAFSPGLPEGAMQDLRATPTWMAGHAKLLAVYERPFWREAGLSGDAMSRRGPLVEIHDASPNSGDPYALFGFLGLAAGVRAQLGDRLVALAREQLGRLFGPEALYPLDLKLQDWAFERFTATALDHASPSDHPNYGLPSRLRGLWEGRLLLAATEVAPHFGGFLEGALEASEIALGEIQSRFASGAGVNAP